MGDFKEITETKSKAELRRLLRDHRDRMSPEEVARASARIHKKLFALPEFIDARTVLFYMSFRNEVDTHRMIQRSIQIGKGIALPRIVVDTGDLAVYQIHDIERDTDRGILGIVEPNLDGRRCEDLNKIDLCIVPGIVFDRRGHRIGWGKGFYDKFFSKLPPKVKKFGLAYDFQVVDRIDSHHMDVPIHGLITESEVLKFNSE